MFEILDTVGEMNVNRGVDRIERYDSRYWSADKVLFAPRHTPQTKRGMYLGKIYIVRVLDETSIASAAEFLLSKGIELAEVIEGFEFGAKCADRVKQHGVLFVPGTIGKPTPKSPDQFCPRLRMFGESVSYGIEHLQLDRDGKPILPAGTRCLVREAYK